jgi:hypothetical protein
MTTKPLVVVAYGGGTNSTALLVGLHERGERPDLILFADTGGEKPETYAYLDVLDAWLAKVDFPPLIRVRHARKDGTVETLEDRSINTKSLPSIAYGYKACSEKWKRRPQDKYVNSWQPAKDAWFAGEKCIKLIGYDADEDRRVANAPKEDNKYIYQYLLYEWNWDRRDCVDAIKRAGLPLPGKSACFFCPSSKKREVLDLKRKHPELYERACAIEKNANLDTVKGLGRNWAWSDLPALAPYQQASLLDPEDIPCGCFDGGDE